MQARAGILLLVCDFTEELERAWVGNIMSLKNACRNPTPSDLVPVCVSMRPGVDLGFKTSTDGHDQVLKSRSRS